MRRVETSTEAHYATSGGQESSATPKSETIKKKAKTEPRGPEWPPLGAPVLHRVEALPKAAVRAGYGVGADSR